MTSHFKNLNPLQVAIIDGNSDLVLKLRESKWRFEKDINGFSPLELADLLGKDQIQKLLVFRKPITIKLQQNDQNSPQLITAPQFEKIFNVVYRRCLTFTSYELLTEVIHECPYFFRVQWLFGKKDYLEAYYLECLLHQKEAKTFVKWIDPIFEYGLFADEDLLENTFIGQ